ncbi:MAG: CHRD domain-containing protein [Burkholderiaceae bacterium]
MTKIAALLAAGVLVSTMSTLASAQPVVEYRATLSGAAEAPPNASPGAGQVTLTLDQSGPTSMLRVQASFSDLSGPVTAAHIHCCTATAGAGTAGVATQVPTFVGFPATTTGSYDQTFDMGLAASYNPSFVTGHGGTLALAFADLMAGLNTGQAYFNIHTANYPGGEIRGFLTAVPEPGTYAMLALGLVAVAGMARQRRGR